MEELTSHPTQKPQRLVMDALLDCSKRGGVILDVFAGSGTDDGRYRWGEQDWNSLSEIARTITGTRWSGPAFFGTKPKRPRAA
jgi:hypothetical protein